MPAKRPTPDASAAAVITGEPPHVVARCPQCLDILPAGWHPGKCPNCSIGNTPKCFRCGNQVRFRGSICDACADALARN